MSDAMRAETVQITGHGGDTIEAYLAQPLDGTADRRGGGDPPHARIRRSHQGDHQEVRRPRLPRRLPQPLLPRGSRGQPRRRRGHGPGPGGRARRAPGRRRRGGGRPPPVAPHRPTARWPPSATAPAAASRSSPPAASTSMPPSTATAPSSSLPRPRAFRSRSSPSPTWPKTCRVPCSGCSVPRTSTRHPRRSAELEKVLTEAGKEFEFHTYEGAGHAFFATDRPSYRPEAAVEGWQRIWEFFGRHLGNG